MPHMEARPHHAAFEDEADPVLEALGVAVRELVAVRDAGEPLGDIDGDVDAVGRGEDVTAAVLDVEAVLDGVKLALAVCDVLLLPLSVAVRLAVAVPDTDGVAALVAESVMALLAVELGVIDGDTRAGFEAAGEAVDVADIEVVIEFVDDVVIVAVRMFDAV